MFSLINLEDDTEDKKYVLECMKWKETTNMNTTKIIMNNFLRAHHILQNQSLYATDLPKIKLL